MEMLDIDEVSVPYMWGWLLVSVLPLHLLDNTESGV